MVLDHYGGVLGVGVHTGKLGEDFPHWQTAIRDLAKRPNVSVKLGGLSMRTAGFGLREREAPLSSQELATLWKPYFETCLEAFGPQRCMFESNFPVDKVCVRYDTLWNAFKRLASSCSDAEKSSLFLDTASRVYRLDVAK
jgi:L-fuconolactonase